MNHRNLDNNTLDRIGQRLVKVAHVPDREIEKLIDNSEHFSLVTKRIGRVTDDRRSHSTLFLFIRQNAVAFACAAILLIAVVVVASLLRPEKTPSVSRGSGVPAKQPETIVGPPVIPPEGTIEGKLSAGVSDDEEFANDDDDYRVETALHKPRPQANTPRRATEVVAPEGDFLPVTYTGDVADTAAGGRILRVELKRSSLFALGVNLPLENDHDELVKADLLVGRDGVTRGIRIVN